MNLLKRCLALLLAMVLCLGLAACGGSDDPVDETSGDDWRDSGAVVDSGTITHEGEGSVYVLVTVDSKSAAFYRDEAEQILFDSVSFPMEVPDAQEFFAGIYFDDISGDGESDVCIDFIYGQDDILSLVWIWDPVERYVYREDLSMLPTDGGDISEYVGLWEYVDEDVWIRIYEDGTWECLDDRGVAFQSGTLSVDSYGVTFYSDDFDEMPRFDRTESGSLYDAENDGTLVLVYDDPFNRIDLSDFIGLWEYVGENLWLRIYDDESWAFFNDQEDVIATGTLAADSSGITLYFDGSGDVMQLDFAVSGDLLDAENNGTLVPAEKIESRVPFFARNGLEINAAMDTGTYWLENGVCSYSSSGNGYYVGDCYWEVTKNYDYTHDGIREIQFDAIAYIPKSSIGSFQQTQIEVSSALYDYYTGAALPVSATHNNSERGDNYYVYAIEWNGESVEIEFAFSSEWQFYVGDWVGILTRSYIVYLPEGYDGLVLALEPQPGNRSDYDNKTKMNDTWDGMTIMDLDVLDPYGCLFFAVCD